jgi:GINS complex subunit 3
MYFDLDDILAESQKFSGSFQLEVDNIGFLMNADAKSKISIREKIELPFWLVTALTHIFINEDMRGNTKSIFSVERPEYLSKLANNFYKASPLNADLSIITHFYKIVEKWCSFIDQPELIDTVFEMLVARASKINDLSFNVSETHSRENVEFLQTLDSFERDLFKLSTESYSDTKAWMRKVSH